jgi:glycosyltransferase involved in cell wall biosynthesis
VTAAVLPKISVAIVTYNQRAYLEEAIESVLSQRYPDLEIVVADDCSTDGTQELLRGYDERYPGLFKLILGSHNVGISGNCNRALFACTRDCVALLAGDDLMLPGRLLQQAIYMESNLDCAACFHDLEIFESSSGKTIGRFSDTYPIGKLERSPLKTIVRYGFAGGPGAMVRKSMSPPGGFNEEVPRASDGLFFIELASRGRVSYFPETLTRYRRHSANASRDHRHLITDLLRTFEIVNERYPELRADTRYALARLRYSQGVYDVQAKEWGSARHHLSESMSLSWLGWKWFLWYIRAAIRR